MRIFTLLISVLIAQGAGFLGSLYTMPKIDGWYMTLTKPELNPPSWIFGPVWTTLYLLMGIAAWRIWEKRKQKKVIPALSVYGIHLVFNAWWSIIFFGFQNVEYAFYWIIVLFASILFTMYLFFKIDRLAAYLFVPYIAWVSFASYLNYSIWQLNK